ncbi:Retrovirus-related Pol polyprotein from transposon TNT 1-94 [Linum grandiflorum]
MVSEPATFSDSVGIRFNGKNYALWEYSFRTFIEGKGLLSYLDGSCPKPTASGSMSSTSAWSMNNARVLSYIIGSVEPAIALTLRSFPSAASVWKHLGKTYTHVNTSRYFDLEYALANLTQGELSINDYYLAATHLWTELDLISTVLVSGEINSDILKERQRSRSLQFLMRLRPDYEQVRSRIIASGDMDMDNILGELIRAETRFVTQAHLDGQSAISSAFATNRHRPQFYPSNGSSGQQHVAANNSGGLSQSGNSQVKCHFCQEVGHPQALCRKRNICAYCKKPGHIIVECKARGRKNFGNSRGSTSYATQAVISSSPLSSTHDSDTSSLVSAPVSSSQDLSQLVQAELARVLPQALNSAFATLGLSGNAITLPWFLDSAAFNHMTGDASIFDSYTPLRNQSVEVANGQHLDIAGVGTVKTSTITLPSTLHVPNLVPNLVSVGQLTESGCDVLFGKSGCIIQDRVTRTKLGQGSKQGRNYHLASFTNRRADQERDGNSCGVFDSFSSNSYSVKLTSEQLWYLWHNRLGHPHSSRLLDMFRNNSLPVTNNMHKFSVPECLSCIAAKTIALPFHSSTTEIHDSFALIHTDVWGPSPVTSRLGYRYFVLFIDHKTRFTWVYFLRLKSELILVLKEFVTMIQTQFNRRVKMFRSDPGGEFTSSALHQYFRDNGILFQQSCPGVSEQNGLVERKHRHVLDLTRALLLESRVPPQFWVETVRTVVHLINSQPTPVLSQTSPYEQLYGKLPDYSRLRVFGCSCFVLLPKKDRNKLSAKTVRCVFLGYSDHHKGYVCYDPIHRRIHIAYHVIFLEHLFYYHNPPPPLTPTPPHLPHFFDESIPHLPATISTAATMSTDTISPSPHHIPSSSSHSPISSTPSTPISTASPLHNLPSSPIQPPTIATPPIQPRRSSRSTQGIPPSRFTDYVSYSTDVVSVPTSYKQAYADPNWNAAMHDEFHALHENHTWTVVDRPHSALVIGSGWVFTTKFNPDGSLERYKARLVAHGNRQEYGLDYDETFAPVAKMKSVRVLLALAAQSEWPLYQLDFKNAFLHGTLKETVYMEYPPGFPKPTPNAVCLLHRSLYGLKQAPRAWFETFQSLLLTSGFQQSKNDPSLFTKTSPRGITVLLLYVDDMILSGSDTQGISEIRSILSSQFKLKELGELSYFLGLQVSRSSKGILVSQQKYISDLLAMARLSDCRPCSTPMELNLKLSTAHGDPVPDPTLYRRLVGSLVYLTSTRPDLSYAVQVVSQFLSDPRMPHQQVVFRILRYLQGTRDHGLFFPARCEFRLTAYADADYAGCIDTRRSTSGWCVAFGDSLVSWRCKKQDKVSKSSTEAEYRSMSDVCSEVVWLIRLLTDLGVSVPTPVHLFGDNTSAIQIAANPVLHERTKHIETHIHYIRDLVHDETVKLFYVSSEEQVADLLTKAVSTSRHWFLSGKLMLRSRHQFEGGC